MDSLGQHDSAPCLAPASCRDDGDLRGVENHLDYMQQLIGRRVEILSIQGSDPNCRCTYFDDFVAKDQPVYRVSVPGGQLEQVAGLESVQTPDALDFRVAGLTPQDVPLVNACISSANFYSMNLDEK